MPARYRRAAPDGDGLDHDGETACDDCADEYRSAANELIGDTCSELGKLSAQEPGISIEIGERVERPLDLLARPAAVAINYPGAQSVDDKTVRVRAKLSRRVS